MKILFLDIDGVLVLDRPGVFVPDLLHRLKGIVDATGCSIVLSSDWRRRKEGLRIVREQLQRVDLDFVATTRPTLQEGERPVEIADWIREQALPSED